MLHVLGLARIHKYINALLRFFEGSNQALFRVYAGATKARLRRYYCNGKRLMYCMPRYFYLPLHGKGPLYSNSL
jgi:hypothetical protein